MSRETNSQQTGGADRVARGGASWPHRCWSRTAPPRERRRRRSSSTTRSRSRPPTRGGRSIRPPPWSTTRSTTRSSRTRAATWHIRFRCSCRRTRRARTRRPTPSSSSGTSTSPTARRSRRPTSSSRSAGSINLKGNPSFLLAGITVSAPSKYTVVMRSKTPATQLPVILANPSTGILNSALVKKHGGTDAANAAKADKAENWLNSPASAGAGSGPYTLNAYSTTSQITLTPNTQYWGAKKSRWSSVVVRNMVAATQLLNVGRGSHEIAVDLSADQAQTLKSNKNVNGLAAAVDLDLLRLRQQRPEGLRGHVEQELPEGDPLRARLRLDREPRRARARSRPRASSRRCSSARCRRAPASRRTSRRPRRRSRRRASAIRR